MREMAVCLLVVFCGCVSQPVPPVEQERAIAAHARNLTDCKRRGGDVEGCMKARGHIYKR